MPPTTHVTYSHMILVFCALGALVVAAHGVNGCKVTSFPGTPTEPRDYQWRIDTISVSDGGSTAMRAIWGFSSGDVYIGGNRVRITGKLWHYDGARWTPVRLSTTEGGPIAGGIGDISELHGTRDGTLYAVGPNVDLSAFMIRFRDGRWVDVSPDSTRLLVSVFAADADSVWVGGINGTLFRFDNRTFTFTPQQLPLDIPPEANPFWLCTSIAACEGKPPVLIVYRVQTSQYYLLECSGGSWVTFDSLNRGRERLWYSPEGTLWAVGDGVHRRNGATWVSMYPELYVYGITGTSDRNLFVAGRFGTTGRVFHYDGIDWHLYTQVELPNAVFYDCWTNGTHLFVVGVLDGYPAKSVVVQAQ